MHPRRPILKPDSVPPRPLRHLQMSKDAKGPRGRGGSALSRLPTLALYVLVLAGSSVIQVGVLWFHLATEEHPSRIDHPGGWFPATGVSSPVPDVARRSASAQAARPEDHVHPPGSSPHAHVPSGDQRPAARAPSATEREVGLSPGVMEGAIGWVQRTFTLISIASTRPSTLAHAHDGVVHTHELPDTPSQLKTDSLSRYFLPASLSLNTLPPDHEPAPTSRLQALGSSPGPVPTPPPR